MKKLLWKGYEELLIKGPEHTDNRHLYSHYCPCCHAQCCRRQHCASPNFLHKGGITCRSGKAMMMAHTGVETAA